MKWKRSKKAQQEAKSGHREGSNNSSSGSGSNSSTSSSGSTSKESRPNSSSRSPASNGEDEKSGKAATSFSTSRPPNGATAGLAPPQPPPMSLVQRSPYEMDYSTNSTTVLDMEKNSGGGGGNGAALLMTRPPLFFAEDVGGEMFRPYVS